MNAEIETVLRAYKKRFALVEAERIVKMHNAKLAAYFPTWWNGAKRSQRIICVDDQPPSKTYAFADDIGFNARP